jgi:hypothetical protein
LTIPRKTNVLPSKLLKSWWNLLPVAITKFEHRRELAISVNHVRCHGSVHDGSGVSIATECDVLLPEISGTGAVCSPIFSQKLTAATVHLNMALSRTRDRANGRCVGVIVEGNGGTSRPVMEVFAERVNQRRPHQFGATRRHLEEERNPVLRRRPALRTQQGRKPQRNQGGADVDPAGSKRIVNRRPNSGLTLGEYRWGLVRLTISVSQSHATAASRRCAFDP